MTAPQSRRCLPCSANLIPLLGQGGLCPTNRAWTNSVRKYAISIRRSPIWNILLQSALSITMRHNGLLRIVQKDVPNWRSANADCASGAFSPISCAKPLLKYEGGPQSNTPLLFYE